MQPGSSTLLVSRSSPSGQLRSRTRLRQRSTHQHCTNCCGDGNSSVLGCNEGVGLNLILLQIWNLHASDKQPCVVSVLGSKQKTRCSAKNNANCATLTLIAASSCHLGKKTGSHMDGYIERHNGNVPAEGVRPSRVTSCVGRYQGLHG